MIFDTLPFGKIDTNCYLKIPHGEAQQPALVLQQQAEGVLPGHDLMDALSCGLNGSLSGRTSLSPCTKNS